jgi:hypothetical protein
LGWPRDRLATRLLFGNRGDGCEPRFVQYAVAVAITWPLLLVATFLRLSVQRYRQIIC